MKIIYTVLLLLVFANLPAKAQQKESDPLDFSRNPESFPRFYNPYRRQRIAPPLLVNSPQVTGLIRAGTMELTLAATIEAVVENNLAIAMERVNIFIAQTDILRARSGQAPRGLTSAPVPSGLFSSVIGAGVGQTLLGGAGGGAGGGAAISGRARSLSIPPLGTFDPSLNFSLSLDRAEVPLNTSRVAGVPVVTTHTTAFQVNYQQAFTSGTGLSFAFSGTRQSSTQQFLEFNPSVSTNFSFIFTQKFLNGFSFSVNRRFLEVARNNKSIVREVFRQRLIEMTALAQSAYWDLVAARERIRNAERALAVVQRLLLDNQIRFEVGTVARLEVVSARSEMAARNRDLILARTDYQSKALELKNLFSKVLDATIGAADIVVTDPLPNPRDFDIPPLSEALALASKNRPELRQTEQSLHNSDIVVNFTRDSLKPNLSFFALFVSRGLFGDRTISDPSGGPPIILHGGFKQSFRQVRQADFPEYAFGITLTIPLGNRRAQADHIRAQLDQRQQKTHLQRHHNQIEMEVRRAITAVVQGKAQVEAADEAARLAGENSEAEQMKLKAGVSTSYQVILAERDLLAAQFSQVGVRANYASALVEFGRATGTTLEKANIDLDDAMRPRVSDAAVPGVIPKER